VHLLLHSSGLAEAWRAAGKQWVCFFQDTNGLVFRSMLAVLGVSRDRDLDLNSMCIPRLAKQEIGAITRLVFKDGKTVTANTEYNQLGPLLEALGHGSGGDVADPATGFSPFPGNINQLVVKLDSYAATLGVTSGIMEEFVNPKYVDSTRTAFKKPTRLECMMQDYAKVLPPTSQVGFTTSATWLGYSPAKNSIAEGLAKVAAGVSPMSPATAEADMYGASCTMWRLRGCKVAAPEPRTFQGLTVPLGPLLSVSPSFAVTRLDLEAALPRPRDVRLAPGSALVIKGAGKVVIEGLDLQGALVIDTTACPGAHVTVSGLVVRNEGWEVVALSGDEAQGGSDEVDEVLRMRGYRLVKHETHTIALPATQGPFTVSE
jgi:UDP-sugar pyrophosphorylase